MRIIRNKKPLRRDFSNHPHAKGLIWEDDIGFKRTRLKCKLLVFDTVNHMKRFFKKALGHPIPGALGAVSYLAYEVYNVDENGATSLKNVFVDPRYFAVMVLSKKNLDIETICHESVHAAFAFSQRDRIKKDPKAFDNPDENICYPAGAIMANVIGSLRRSKLI
jgi:hypothetical protein